MIGLDTNVLVRYLVQDDPAQSAAATQIIEVLTEDNQGFVSLVTIAELYWVLRRGYRLDESRTAGIVRGLLDSVELEVQEPDAVRRAVSRTTGEGDFADALIAELGTVAGCRHTVTFDTKASKLPGMRLLDRKSVV